MSPKLRRALEREVLRRASEELAREVDRRFEAEMVSLMDHDPEAATASAISIPMARRIFTYPVSLGPRPSLLDVGP